MRCELVVRGEPSTALLEALPDFEVSHHGDTTSLSGWVADQAAFAGVLRRLRSAGAEIVSARCDDGSS